MTEFSVFLPGVTEACDLVDYANYVFVSQDVELIPDLFILDDPESGDPTTIRSR